MHKTWTIFRPKLFSGKEEVLCTWPELLPSSWAFINFTQSSNLSVLLAVLHIPLRNQAIRILFAVKVISRGDAPFFTVTILTHSPISFFSIVVINSTAVLAGRYRGAFAAEIIKLASL